VDIATERYLKDFASVQRHTVNLCVLIAMPIALDAAFFILMIKFMTTGRAHSTEKRIIFI
jgi:hypothetical protein